MELFNPDVYGHLRRCQGFVRSCTKEINTAGHTLASLRIAAAIATMRHYIHLVQLLGAADRRIPVINVPVSLVPATLMETSDETGFERLSQERA